MRIPDYYVRFVDFPPTVLGATLPNDDGTFSVYINARLGDDARRETLRRCYRDLAALTAYLQSLGALGSSMESLGAEPMR